ncbi:hypothetical protein [Streptomyces sp. NPDC088400]|uniref:hypothetical protein n=1 Tax=Streptomyces sp. NPDC088400 TaxID=3365861 RepID=UPI00380FC669
MRYRPSDFGGTMGCPLHTTALQAAHPGSSIANAQEAINTMQTFGAHPDLTDLDEDLDTRYGSGH